MKFDHHQLLNRQHHALFSVSPLDGRYQGALDDVRFYLSEFALIRYRVYVEIKWLIALTRAGLPKIAPLSDAAVTYLNDVYGNFNAEDALRIKQIEAITNHDVKAVEYWLKETLGSVRFIEMFEHMPARKVQLDAHIRMEFGKIIELIHFACTSEDINNTAYGLMLQNVRDVLLVKIEELLQIFKNLAQNHASVAMLSRTHGQSASPTTVGKEMANFYARLSAALGQIRAVDILGKINGAVGNFNAHTIAYPNFDWQAFCKKFIEDIGLSHNAYTTQIEPHDYMAQLFDAYARFNTILIDASRDIWGYISLGYFKQKIREGEVGSSTMPHKVNPIDFENAEGNLGLANALLMHFSQKLPISRWQRDLSDSTVLRSIGCGLGHAFLAYKSLIKGLHKLEIHHERLKQDLDQNWEVLGEAIQTVMRRHGIHDAYEQLKALTRGRPMNKALLQQFIAGIAIPDEDKQRLLKLTPETYTGYASHLAHQIGQH